MQIKISRFRKYLTWNIVSICGYLGLIMGLVFCVMFLLASSDLNMRADLNEYFYHYITKHVVTPYIELYKTQLTIILVSIVLSLFEHRYNLLNGRYGLRWFANHEKTYSILFFVGLVLNFLPAYVFYMVLIIKLRSLF